jgi:hypothetical protein
MQFGDTADYKSALRSFVTGAALRESCCVSTAQYFNEGRTAKWKII